MEVYHDLRKNDHVCPEPCDKMLVYFGFPFLDDSTKSLGSVKLYLKRLVKQIEDQQDYTLLRFVTTKSLKRFTICKVGLTKIYHKIRAERCKNYI